MGGLFLSFEGIDGSGKSTQLRLLATHIERRGRHLVQTREPGGTPLGEELRRLILHPPAGTNDVTAELLMLNAARAQLVNSVIQPALVGGDVVLADRFFDATLAYQGYGRGGDLAAMRTVIDIAIGPCIPACTLLLDVSVETARRRLEQRGASNFFDSMGPAFAQRVRDGYLALAYAEPGRFLVLDGEAAPEDVCVRLLKELSRRGIVL